MTTASEIVPSTQIVEYSSTAAGLAELRMRLANVLYDVTKAEGMQAARTARRECIDLRVALEAKRKEVKAPHLERGRLIDSEADRIKTAIEELERPIAAQIDAQMEREREKKEEEERRERNRIAEVNAKLQSLLMIPLQVSGSSSADIESTLARLREREITGDEFGEFAGQAAEAKSQSVAKLEGMVGRARENEREAARLKEEADRLATQKREQDEREKQAREAEARRVKARRKIDDLSAMPGRYAGMPAATIETAIGSIQGAKLSPADSEFARSLAEFSDEWMETADRVIAQLQASANLSHEQERQAAELKAKAAREVSEREARAEIQRVTALPAGYIGKDSATVREAFELLRTEHANVRAGTMIEPPWGMCQDMAPAWIAAAEQSLLQLDELLAQALAREDREAERQRAAAAQADRERQAREHAAMEEESKKASDDAIAALSHIATVGADMKGVPDHGIARSKMAGIATGTLQAIEQRKPKRRAQNAAVLPGDRRVGP